MDIRKLPELMNDPELQANFGTFFKRDEAEDYKEEIIQSLIGSSGNRQVAERIYNRMIEDQRNKIYAFEISMEQYKSRLFKKNGVDSIENLPETDRNFFLQKYYTESPFAFAEAYEATGTPNVTKVYYNDNVKKTASEVGDMRYISYLPKSNRFMDTKFETEIASDPTLYKAWEMFEDSLEYINRNRKYSKNDSKSMDDSLTYEYDMYKQHATDLLGMIGYFGKSLRDRIQNVFSTTKYVDTNKDMKLQGSIRSIDEVIEQKMKPLIAMAEAQGLKVNQVYALDSLPESMRNMIIKEIPNIEPGFVLKDAFRQMVERSVLDGQKLDLIDTLSSQLENVEMFKAKKEIETKMLFARNMIEKVKKIGDGYRKKHAINVVRAFINKHLYGVNNRPNWMTYKKSDKNFGAVFDTHEREMIAELNKAINFIKENITEANKEQALEDIKELEQIRDSKGKVVTTGSLFETVAIKLNILVGLGLNVPSQIGNWFMGNIAGRQNDGLEWSEGNYPKAASYTRKWKIARRKLTKKEKQKYKLTNTLIDGLGIFQNSANELDRIKESAYQNKLLKFVSNPLHIVGEMEKTIQRPQILAMMGDVLIKDKNGNTVPAFDVNNTSDPHPAFELDSNGNLKLKEEFDTKENQDTWIKRNSQEYVDLFGESGIVPSMIARINGDYRSTSSTLIKETSVGSLMMMFKTWLPAFIMRRYGKKDGVISGLGESGRSGQAVSLSAMTALMYGGIGAGILVSPLLAAGLTGAYLGYKKHRKLIAEEGNYLRNLLKDIQKSIFDLQFGLGIVRIGAATGVKTVQQGTDLLFGKRYLSNDLINDVAGFKQMDGETTDEFEKNKARLQFLLTEASTTLTLLMLKVLVNATLFPDEDEEEKYKDDKGTEDFDWSNPLDNNIAERYINQPDVAFYYFLENMLTRFASDANLMNDPAALSQTFLSGSMTSTYNKHQFLLNSFIEQYNNGNYQRGPNEGKNRILVNLGKTIVPKGLSDFTLGFGRTMNQDYQLKDPINRIYRSDFDKLEDERKSQRNERKLELRKQYEKRYPQYSKDKIEKKIQRKLRKEFPTIKKYFYPDGSLKPTKKRKVEKYQD